MTIGELADAIERDRREPDKILLYARDVRRLADADIIGARLPVCRVCRSPLKPESVPQGTETNA